jgi:hypothetical protein
MSDLFERLSAPFPPEKVSWRVGVSNKKKRQRETGDNNAKATKGQVLAYIDARDVMDRLDDVCGPAGWQNRYTHADKKTICEIGVYHEGQWIWKADGAGESDIEAEKGALSDSFKRAAVRWGVGRYLYHLPTPWVDLDEREQITMAGRRTLEALLNREAVPARLVLATPPEESGLFIACKAAMDLADTPAAMEQWAADNKASMAKIEADEPAIYRAVRAYYGERLKTLKPRAVA